MQDRMKKLEAGESIFMTRDEIEENIRRGNFHIMQLPVVPIVLMVHATVYVALYLSERRSKSVSIRLLPIKVPK